MISRLQLNLRGVQARINTHPTLRTEDVYISEIDIQVGTSKLLGNLGEEMISRSSLYLEQEELEDIESDILRNGVPLQLKSPIAPKLRDWRIDSGMDIMESET